MEQLAQFVTKSFEFNNCFSAKLLEAKQKNLSGKEVASAIHSDAAEGAFLSFGLSTLSSSSVSSSASNASSNGSGNNSLMMDIDDNNERVDDNKHNDEEDLIVKECANPVEEEEDEIDIETDSMSDLEDNKRLIIKTQDTVQERLRVIKPTDLRIQGLSSRLDRSPSGGGKKDVPSSDDKTLDVNNNNKVIKTPITKNWLIPEDPSE